MEEDILMRRTVLITGGSKGLGLEIVKQFLRKDFNVIIVCRSEFDTSVFNEDSQFVKVYRVDLSDLNNIKVFLKIIEKEDIRIDVLVLNAAPRVFGYFDSFTVDEIIEQTNASFLSSVLLLNAVMRRMKIKKSGKIVVISSKSGLKGYSKGSLYCAFKAAWITFHESISRELEGVEGLSILTICPDSFSNIDGSNRKEIIISKVINKISSSIYHTNSEIFFASTIRNKVSYLLLFIQKFVNTLK